MKPPPNDTPRSQSHNSGESPVRIYSPLHSVLEHFVDRLTEALDAGGRPSVRLPSRDGEVGGNLHAKSLALAVHVRNARRYVHAGGPNVVAWPLVGWWEMPLWRHNSHKTLIAMHDPEPLVRQNGLTPRAAKASARLSGSRWPHLVTMSPEAYAVTRKYFDADRLHLAPHPMRAPDLGTSAHAGRRVLVLGQYKPARDLDVMAKIAPALRAGGWEPTVAGRGWPPVPGWRVIERFLTEIEFTELLGSSAAVLLPYRYYFQSGVALRALEAGVPVVGRQTGFLTSIFGTDFAGAVDNWDEPAAWLAAVEAANSARGDQLRSAADYSARGTAEWAALLG
jgi:glycosyltransferase involved in cell wall biosynthesis